MLGLDRQKKDSDGQLVAMKVLIEQAAVKTRALLSEVGFWKREEEAARAEADDLQELLSPALDEQGARAVRPGS